MLPFLARKGREDIKSKNYVNNFYMKYYFPSSNGISCFNGKTLSTAVIGLDGGKKVASQKSKNKIIYLNWIILRGIQYFFCGLIALFSAFNISYNMLNLEDSKLAKTISQKFYISARYFFIIISIAFSFLLCYLWLGVFPAKLSFVVLGNSLNFRLRAFIIALFKVLLFFAVLLVLRFLPSMQYFYKFNGACARNFNITRQKGVENIKFNWHRPLNFVNFFVFTLLFCIFMVSLVAININWWANILVNLGIVVLSMGFCYEFLYIIEKYPKLSRICIITSWFVSIKPNITQEEIAKVAGLESEISKGEKLSVSEDGMIALSAVYTEMQTKLESKERYEKSDVDWIVATVLNKNRAEIKLIHSISNKQYREIMAATERRAKGEPLSNIFGFVDFYGLRFDINKKVLSPRVETEQLVEEAIKLINANKFKEVCDLCTGSGAIGIAIAKNTNSRVTAIDISKPALQVAINNAKKHNVKVDFIESDLFKGLKKSRKFDIIISNPPYIESKEIDKLDEEVKKYDPRLALDGGEDGLDFYRRIAQEAGRRLNKNGILMFEIGATQGFAVRKIMKDNGFGETKLIKDYEKRERIIYGKIGT